MTYDLIRLNSSCRSRIWFKILICNTYQVLISTIDVIRNNYIPNRRKIENKTKNPTRNLFPCQHDMEWFVWTCNRDCNWFDLTPTWSKSKLKTSRVGLGTTKWNSNLNLDLIWSKKMSWTNHGLVSWNGWTRARFDGRNMSETTQKFHLFLCFELLAFL